MAQSIKSKTNTMLDSSSDSDGSDKPVALTEQFASDIIKETEEEKAQAKPSMIPRTMALPKGRTNEFDLLAQLEHEESKQV